MNIELRFFRKRYCMDMNYYTGDKDVYCRLYFRSIKELREKWKHLFEAEDYVLEGETYSAWAGNEMLCGGAFDPDDIDFIEDNADIVFDIAQKNEILIDGV